MNKKRIFGIALFIIIGLFTFTFANPNEKVEGNDGGSLQQEVKQPVVEETKDTEKIKDTEAIKDNNDTTPQPVVNPNPVVVNVPQQDNLNQNDNQNNLEQIKTKAIEEIKNYQEAKNLQEDEKSKNLVNEAINNINNATSEEEINNIVENTKKELDKIKDELDLDEYKKLAKQELKKYSDSKNFNESYSKLAEKILNEAYNMIDSATSKENIDMIVTITKKALDNLKSQEELEDLRNKAIEEIKNYKKDESYSEENQNKVDEIKKETINKINEAKNDIEKIVEEGKSKIDSILTLKETKYTVKFIGLNDELLKEENVLYGENANAPVVENIVKNGITYSFTTWDKEYTNVTSNLEIKANYNIIRVQANVYNETLISTVELNINDEIIDTITNNIDTVLTTEENKIISLSKDKLPTLDKLNYKYNYSKLTYSKNEGFRIDVKEIIDEEALNKNTVTITYNINSENATFIDGTKEQTSTTYNGKNNVELKDVYINGTKVAVIWTDEDGNVISTISENEVNLKEELTYNKSMILTANLDTTAPVITLNGETTINVDLTYTSEYEEAGYSAMDNFNGDITSKVVTSITLNNIPTNQVDYSKAGQYVITYTVTDTEGNTSSVTRTINVIDKITEIKATVFALNDGVTRPNEKTNLKTNNYHKIGEVNLIVEKVRQYVEAQRVIIATENIASYVIGGESALPQLNEKYYSYECYILKHEKDGFHIDCEKVFDSEAYLNDKKRELNELLDRDYTIYKDTKTNDTYQDLINTVSEIKNSMPTTIEGIEEVIEKINNALNALQDVVLVNLTISSNNDVYTVNSNMKSLTITAVYNDTTKNKVLTKNDYTVNKNFDSKTVGNKSITYSYKNKQVTYNYVVEYSKEQLQSKVNSVEATLKEKISLKKTEYKIIFSNLANDVNIKSINVTKNNKVLNTITLNKNSHDTYSMSRSDYFTLVNNNTTIANKKINITYAIGNQEITVAYYESFNKLHKCK